MKAYKNMKIRSKLVMAFSLLILIALLIGTVGIVGMQMIKTADRELYEENTLPTGYLAVLNDVIASERNAANQVVVFDSADPAYAAEQADYIQEKSDEFLEVLAQYKATIPLDEQDELDLYDALDKQYNVAFAQAKDVLMQASEADDIEGMRAAVLLIDEEGGGVSDIIDEIIEINRSGAQSKVESNGTLAATSTIVAIIVIAIGVAVSGGCVVLINSLIAVPISHMMGVAKQVGETGSLHFTDEVVAQIRKDAECRDEVGQTSLAFTRMVDSLIEKSQVLEQVAAGDLTATVNKASDEDTIGNSLETMINNLNDMFGEVNSATDQVSIGSTQIADGAQALSQGSVEQASSVEELSATIAQVLGQTKESAQNAEDALEIVNEAGRLMGEATGYMKEMQEAMGGISSSSEEIAKVIKVIDDIAFQTNILALNAAVEAARAGQHGKGFAVVADEVRNLASKSADAAKETAALIQTSVEHVGRGGKIVEKTSDSIEKVGVAAGQTQEKIVEINGASRQQEEAITQINEGIEQVSQVVQNNSATAEESAAASEELSGQAQMLKDLVAQFRLKNAPAALGAPAQAAALPQAGYDAPVSSGGDVIF